MSSPERQLPTNPLEECSNKRTGSKKTPRKKPSPNLRMSLEDLFNNLILKTQDRKSLGTGLMYDEYMTSYYSLRDPLYPECPARITEPYKKCLELGLVDRCTKLEVKPCIDGSIIEAKHDPDYIKKVASTVSMTTEELLKFETCYQDVYFHNNSYKCAMLSLGCTIDLVEGIVADKISNGLAILRPPGHHAMKCEANGYCYFNNVALAAEHCLSKLGLQRVLIVDWDVHHGQGTQYMFYDDPRVMYLSIHRYEHGWFWPNLMESNFDYIGEGEGKGYNINIPLNKTGMTDGDYLAIFHQVIMPVAMEFDPDIVLVSAGYDCAIGCPEGEMLVTPPAFSHFVHKLKSLSDGKIAVIQEGGYCIQSLSESIAFSLRGLLDDPCPKLDPAASPKPELVNVLLNVINVLRPYWKCFQYQYFDNPAEAVSLHSSDPRGAPVFMTENNKPSVWPVHDTYPRQNEEEKQTLSKMITDIMQRHPTRQTKHRSCYVYDEFMARYRNIHDPTHPERPERIIRIHEKLEESGLLAKCLKLSSRRVTNEELALVHSMKHINEVAAIDSTKPSDFNNMERKYNSIYLHQDSYKCALLSAGSLLNVVDSVMTDESRNGFAIIRPPGHHAERDTACGFCFFNNVPVAAKYAQQKYGVKRIVIVDWDVHHGNGTQHMFENDDSVLYISLHRYDDGSFFPSSEDADYDKVGKDKGEGYNINIPFNSKRSRNNQRCRSPGDAEYLAAFQQIVIPVCYEYAPDLVFVSAGFDAAKGDPLGGFNVTPTGYAHMTHMLSSLANGRLILALEGGYNLNSISESFTSCVNVMLGAIPPRIPFVTPDWSAVDTIKNVIRVHRRYWKSLCFGVTLPYSPEEQKSSDLESSKSDDNLKSLTAKLQDIKLSGDETSSAVKPTTHTSSTTIGVDTSVIALGTDTSTISVNPDTPVIGASSHALDLSCSLSEEVISSLEECAVSGAQASLASMPKSDQAEFYAVQPLDWCPHLSEVQEAPPKLDVYQSCEECGDVKENWVCLMCYKVLCSRFVNEHMLFHSLSTEHMMALSFSDLSVWCYACESYVDHKTLKPVKAAAESSKFHTRL